MEGSKLIKDRSTAPTEPVVTETTRAIPTFDGIPLTVLDYFGISPMGLDNETKNKLNDTWEHFKGEKDPFLRMAEVERKIGKGGYERTIDKLWRYAKLNNQIKSLTEQRKILYGEL